MKIAVRLMFAVFLLSFATSFSQAEPRQIMQGTQMRLRLLTDISTSLSRNGDGFVAVTTEPVMLGNQQLLPAGTRIRGIVTSISHARHFALLRGEAYLNLTFRSVEIDSRLIPVQMSIIAISKPSSEGEGSRRKDVTVTEGQLLQETHDIKGSIIAGTIGTGGSTVIGKLASHAAAGLNSRRQRDCVASAKAGKWVPWTRGWCAWITPSLFLHDRIDWFSERQSLTLLRSRRRSRGTKRTHHHSERSPWRMHPLRLTSSGRFPRQAYRQNAPATRKPGPPMNHHPQPSRHRRGDFRPGAE